MFVVRFAGRDSELSAAEGSVHCWPGDRLRGEYKNIKQNQISWHSSYLFIINNIFYFIFRLPSRIPHTTQEKNLPPSLSQVSLRNILTWCILSKKWTNILHILPIKNQQFFIFAKSNMGFQWKYPKRLKWGRLAWSTFYESHQILHWEHLGQIHFKF